MEIKFFIKDVDLTDSLRAYIEKKVQVFVEKYFKELEILEVRVELGVDHHHHHHGKVQRVEITICVPHQILRAEESANDIYTAFDGIIPKLETQIEKYKYKKNSKYKSQNAKTLK